MINPQEIRKWYDIFHSGKDNALTEIRLLGKTKGKELSGYFTDAEEIINALSQPQYTDGFYGIYAPINRILPACAGRAQFGKLLNAKTTTSGSDIAGRNWILIDLDPKRPSDTNSSDEEKQAAYALMVRIATFLRDQGFKSPVYADSANGFHLYYRISLANSEENTQLVKDFLAVLDMMFSNGAVDVDTAVFDANRISKVIGTSSNKGISTEERPQRMSYFLQVPYQIEVTDAGFIRKVAALLPKREKPSRENGYRSESFDLEGFIQQHGIEIEKRTRFGSGERLVLKCCPFDSNHKAPDAALFRLDSGAIGFRCLHNSCSHYSWRDFRLHYDPNAYDKRYVPSRDKSYRPAENKPIEIENAEKGSKWQAMGDIRYKDTTDIPHVPTGIKQLDEKIIGLAEGDLTVLSGCSGAGKTSLLDFILLNAAQQGYTSLVWSGEMQDYRFQTWLDRMAAGPNFVKPKIGYNDLYYVPRDTAAKINKWLGDKILLYNNDYGNRFSQLFADVKEKVKETNAKLIVIDNLMAMYLDSFAGDSNERQSQFITELKNFAKQTNIHVVLVCHPRKEAGFQLLRKESIAGTADLTNAADNVFIIHRVGRDFKKRAKEFYPDSVLNEIILQDYGNVVEVCKHRTTGLVDELIGLYYEPKSKRFLNEPTEYIVYGWQDDTLPLDYVPQTTQAEPKVEQEQSAEQPKDTYAPEGSFPFPMPEATNTTNNILANFNEEEDDLPF